MFYNKINSLFLLNLYSFVFSFIFSILGIYDLIIFFKKKNFFQTIRTDCLESHLITKQKTPTMGGLIMGLSILFSSILFTDPNNVYIKAIMMISIIFFITGLVDDALKIFLKDTKGFKGSIKIVIQLFLSCLVLLWLLDNDDKNIFDSKVFIPFFKISLDFGKFFLPFCLFVIVGSGNAVNLTDGLDGLAIIPIIISAFCFVIK